MEQSTLLRNKLEEIISEQIHKAKSSAFDDKVPLGVWKAIDSKRIAADSVKEIIEILELWLYIPCCHIDGMHDPTHFTKRKYICNHQLADAFKRFCRNLGINPVTRSDPSCSRCRNYPHYRKGEGLELFKDAAGMECRDHEAVVEL